jgi:sugar lactone lactonase YvrE
MKNYLSIALLTFVGFLTINVAASELWKLNGLSDFLKGDARGVSISSDGIISPAPAMTTILNSNERLAWSAATDSKGIIYVGTGGSGKLFIIDAKGASRLLATLPEVNVTAVAIGSRDELFAATSPDGKVYRVQSDGTFSIHFEPREKYIWAMTVLPDRSLAVATGDGGRIYKVASQSASRESALLLDSPESNITTLAVGPDGTLYAGTDPSGLVIAISPNGAVFSVLDSPLREIRDISIEGDKVFILAVADGITTNTNDAEENKSASSVQTVKAGYSESITKSRNDTSSSKSIVHMLRIGGGHEIIWNSPSVIAFSLLATKSGEVLIGTADKGRIYSVNEEAKRSLLIQTDELQISRMIRSGGSIVGVSGAGGRAISIGPDEEKSPIYLSPVLDARNVARWGRMSWLGKGSATMEIRSGNVEQPDSTWSSWILVSAEIGKANVPNSRFFQKRATLKPGSSVGELSVAFAQLNVAPEVIGLQVLPTNVGLAPNVQMPSDPNIEASGMDPALFGQPSGVMPPRKLYQRGAISLQWNAEDGNGDKLMFDVMVRGISDSEFKTIRRDIPENYATIDGLTLADGRYIFKIVAKDSLSNPIGQSLVGSLTSDSILIDNSPPTVSQIGNVEMDGRQATIRFEAVDRGDRVTRAEYSVNGGEWTVVISDDGINDDPTERFTVRIPTLQIGEYSIVIRVHDMVGNSGSTRSVIMKR